MKFAENNRISQRQLRRQIVLSYLGPMCLCLLGRGGVQGFTGVWALLLGFLSLFLYFLFLLRLYPVFGDLKKWAGSFWGKAIGLYFTAYVIVTAAILLSVLEEVLPMGFLIGVPKWQIGGLAAVVCAVGTHKGIQRRGRMAEVSGGILLLGVLLFLLFSVKEGSVEFLSPMWRQREVTLQNLWGQWYACVCGFAGISLLPFSLSYVEKRGCSGKSVTIALGILFVLLLALLFLLPAVLGWERVQAERYPILPLLAGTDLPGDVLARFDVLWMCLLLFSLLFAIGSLFFYGSHILQSAGLGRGCVWATAWMAAMSFALSMDWIPNWSVRGFYIDYLKYIFVPGTLLLHLFLLVRKQRRGKRGILAVLLFGLLLQGCAGVEPEKRLYPLALAIDYEESGGFQVLYGMANLTEETGQGKAEEGGTETVLTLRGKDFSEIRNFYEKSQQKYLDLGHLQVLILGKAALERQPFDEILRYLLEEPMTGEDLYLFQTDDVEAILTYEKAQEGSVGDYLKGIYENRAFPKGEDGVNLREAYAHWYQDSEWREIPEICIEEGELVILEEGK